MNRILTYLLMACVCLSSCTDDTHELASAADNVPVTLTLSYKNMAPVEVESRATDAEENAIYDLEVFIFDKEGKLKGWKKVDQSNNAGWDQVNQTIQVKTRTGKSYIYAIANDGGDIYSEESDKAGVTFDEVDALRQNIEFTRNDFKALQFRRVSGEIDCQRFAMSGSVNGEDGCTIALNGDGTGYVSEPTTDDDRKIALRRIVAKVKFEIKAADGIKFVPTGYDICNIPTKVNVVKGLETVTGCEYENVTGLTFGTQATHTFEVYLPENMQVAKKTVSELVKRETNNYGDNIDNKTFTNAPENGTYVVLYGDYEKAADNEYGNVEYTIHLGDFSKNVNDYNNERNYKYTYTITVEGVNNIKKEAKKEQGAGGLQPGAEGYIVNYKSGKSYILDSHYEQVMMRFYYNEIYAMKHNSEGTHGYVFGVKTPFGEITHMEVTDKENGSYPEVKVSHPGDGVNGNVEHYVREETINGVDIDWIEFYLHSGWYDEDHPKGVGVINGYSTTEGQKYNIVELLAYLYEHADYEDMQNNWSSSSDDRGPYIDVACYISENYYEHKSWDTYVNQEPRSFYIASNVDISNDKASTYITANYHVSQYAIQTFYDRSQADKIVAYGCETINDEAEIDPNTGKPRGIGMMEAPLNSIAQVQGKGRASVDVGDRSKQNALDWEGVPQNRNGGNVDGTNSLTFDGRYLMKRDLGGTANGGDNQWNDETIWNYELSKQYLYYACMARNRDLNKDGKIHDQEIRWYTPSLPQYMGLWIGEDAMATNARLYTGNTQNPRIMKEPNVNYNTGTGVINSIGGDGLDKDAQNFMHYFTSSNPLRTFWAEEGLSYGYAPWDTGKDDGGERDELNYVRCIRNLKSGTPDNPYNGVDQKTGEEIIKSNEYYTYDEENHTIDMTYVDRSALRTSVIMGELGKHHERDPQNKVRSRFQVAEDRASNGYDKFTLKEVQTGIGSDSPCYDYKEGNEANGTWRVPNQREFALGVILGEINTGESKKGQVEVCRTQYSGAHRYGYYVLDQTVKMITLRQLRFPAEYQPYLNDVWKPVWLSYTFNGNDFGGTHRVKCVRDVAREGE